MHQTQTLSIVTSPLPVIGTAAVQKPLRGVCPPLRTAQSTPPDPYMSRTRFLSIIPITAYCVTDHILLPLVGSLGCYHGPAHSAGDLS